MVRIRGKIFAFSADARSDVVVGTGRLELEDPEEASNDFAVLFVISGGDEERKTSCRRRWEDIAEVVGASLTNPPSSCSFPLYPLRRCAMIDWFEVILS
jgi:hypothetical protein